MLAADPSASSRVISDDVVRGQMLGWSDEAFEVDHENHENNCLLKSFSDQGLPFATLQNRFWPLMTCSAFPMKPWKSNALAPCLLLRLLLVCSCACSVALKEKNRTIRTILLRLRFSDGSGRPPERCKRCKRCKRCERCERCER